MLTQASHEMTNNVYQSVHTLPNEIWCEVFAICTQLVLERPLTYLDFPLNVMWTCKAFNALILGYTPAWTSFTVRMGRNTPLEGYTLVLTTLSSARVAPFSFNLHFPSRGVSRYPSRGIAPPVFNRSKWKSFTSALGRNLVSLNIHNISTTELAVIPPGVFPFLESLVCSGLGCTSVDPVIAFQSATRLRKVALRPYSAKIVLPRQGITHLAMWNCGPAGLADNNLSSIQMLHISTGLMSLPSYNPSNPTPNLKYLTIDNNNTYNFSRALIPMMGVALTDLTLVTENFRQPHLGLAFPAFCSTLEKCKNLRSLGILTDWAELDVFLNMLKSVPNLTKLELGVGHWHGSTYQALLSTEYVPLLEHLSMHVKEPLPSHLDDVDILESNVDVLDNQMSLSEGKIRVQTIIAARGPHPHNGALKSFTFLEWDDEWDRVAKELDGDVEVKSVRAAILYPATRVGEILSRDCEAVNWPQLRTLVDSVTRDRVMGYHLL
jgi:hypothetical protein